MKLIDYICQASGWTPVNRRAETMMTKAELFAQDIVLKPGFDKPRKPGIVKRLGDLSKRALDGFKFFAA